MNRIRRGLLFTIAVAATTTLASAGRSAQADEVAPELEALELRQRAQAEASRLLAGLSEADQRRLRGAYVAFDANPNDPSAMAACDDDGDYVIVVTDAMLRLASIVARAQSADEVDGSRSVEDYAAFVGRAQVPGRRLLPPPPGFYAAPSGGATHTAPETRLRESLAFVIARELTLLRSGDLVCPHPTATHEEGDDRWTPSEQRRALEAAASLYPGRAPARDEEATWRVLEIGRNERGALGLLRFFAHLELERPLGAGRFVPTYLVLHPGAITRVAAIEAAAAAHRSEPRDHERN